MNAYLKPDRLSQSLACRVGAAAAIVGMALGAPAFAQNVAVVNGKPIPKQLVDDFVAMAVQQGRPDNAEIRELARRELIRRELLAQAAEKQGLTKTPEVARQLNALRTEVLASAAVRSYIKANPVKDADIRAEYDRVVKTMAGGKEFKVRHILVDNQDLAKKITEELKKGAKFEEQAKQSKDPGSKDAGGDLGWAAPQQFVKPFSEAMVKLSKGQTTEAPVQSEFGWHIIRVDDIRDAKAPSYEEVKAQIQQGLTQKKIGEYVKQLEAEAKIQ